MESFLTGTLGFLGKYLVDNDVDSEITKTLQPIPAKEYPGGTIYEQQNVPRNRRKHRLRAQRRTEKSRDTINTNIVPRYYDRDYQEKEQKLRLNMPRDLTRRPSPLTRLLENQEKDIRMRDTDYFETFGCKMKDARGKEESFLNQFNHATFDNTTLPVSSNESHCSNNEMNIVSLDRSLAMSGGWSAFNQDDDMTYRIVPREHFTHNNMTPFFTGKGMEHNDYNDHNRNRRVELFSGSSKNYIPKKATKRFFEPVRDLTNVFGFPNSTEFLQSRYVPSRNRAKQLPFEEQLVPPGLNLGYHEEPKHGFHDPYRPLPKTVDELRTATNPKITYHRPIIHGQKGSLRPNQAPVIKRRPETFREYPMDWQTPDRGVETAPRVREQFIVPPTNRTQSVSYTGPAQSTNHHTLPESMKGYYQKPNRNRYKHPGIQNPKFHTSKRLDTSNTYVLPETERETVNAARPGVAGNGAFQNKSQAYNPCSIAKPTVKESTIHQNRPGVAGGGIFQNRQTAYNPNSVARPTVKETTIHQNRTGNYGGVFQNKATAYNPNSIARPTVKETTIHQNHTGYFGGVEQNKQQAYNPNSLARPTVKETTIHQNHTGYFGGIEQNKQTAYNPNSLARPTVKETTIHQNHTGYFGGIEQNKQTAYNPNNLANPTIKETTLHYQRPGLMGGVFQNKQTAYNPNSLARPTVKETTIHQNHTGYFGGVEQNKSQAYNPNDLARTTVKETTIHYNRPGLVGNGIHQNKQAAYNPNNMARETIKETTIHQNRAAMVGGGIYQNKQTAYNPNNLANPTIKETTIHQNRPGIAGNGAFQNKGTAYNPNNLANPTIKETTIHQNRPGIAAPVVMQPKSQAYNPNTIIPRTTIKETVNDIFWGGPARFKNQEKRVNVAEYNMQISDKKEKAVFRRPPTQVGPQQTTAFTDTFVQLRNPIQVDYGRKLNLDMSSVSHPERLAINISSKMPLPPTFQYQNDPEILENLRRNPLVNNVVFSQNFDQDMCTYVKDLDQCWRRGCIYKVNPLGTVR